MWAPKYRKWVLLGAVRGERTGIGSGDSGASWVEIEGLEVDKDYVHVFLSFPTKYSTGQVVGLLKAVSAREIRAGSVTDLQHAG